ncbi:MAG: DEAD/DEAH box helicase [Candidatus Bathyarchaeia archaeon]|nr:DEAD/DEAH box helicase [Candidatus Bathyarchaeota archaeon]
MRSAFSLLDGSIVKLLMDEGIVQPSDVQEMAIPRILQGKNLLVIAPTGVGKTYAAVLPVFNLYLSARARGEGKPISILYITPLRALNRDVYRRLISLGEALGIRVDVRHGDTPSGARYSQALKPPEMLITTPETLQAILPGARMKSHLRNVRWVIVDEVHELASDKRGSQLTLGLERLRNLTHVEFQRIGLSATVGSLYEVGCFLAGTGRPFEVVKSSELKELEVSIEFLRPTPQDASEAEALGVPPSSIARARRIMELVSRHGSTLIFTNTREHAEALGSLLHALKPDLPVKVHHGSLSREIREDVEAGFQRGEVKAIVCTSSLELGIDVGSVDLVVQYMSPRQATKLVQRVGRSGHRLGARSRGIVIAGWADEILESAVLAKRLEADDLERPSIHVKPYDVLAHQVVGLALDSKGVYFKQLYETVRRAYPYASLTEDELKGVLGLLEDIGLVRIEGDLVKPRRPRAHRYYYENLSVIPDVKRYTVYDFVSRRRIGTLDQEFVARRCSPGTDIIMHGYTWRILRVDDEELKVEVEPAEPSLKAIPTWEGEMIPVEYETAMEVGRLREVFAGEPSFKGPWSPPVPAKLSDEAVRRVNETIREHMRIAPLPTDRRVLVECFENNTIIHVCLGNRANEALALALSTLLGSKYGVSAGFQVDPYRIALTTPYRMEAEMIVEVLRSLDPGSLREILRESLEDSPQFAWRHWHVARRFGIVERKADYSLSKARSLVKVFRNSLVHSEAEKELYTEQLDLKAAEEFLESLSEGKVEVAVHGDREACTPLAAPILDKIMPRDLLRPALPSESLVEIVKERIGKSLVKLLCIHRGDWESIKMVEMLPEKLRCPRCRATLIAVTHPRDGETLRIVEKRIKGRRLSREEEESWRQAWRSASLVQVYGKRAVIVLAGRGIGPATAVRVLRRPLRREDEVYAEILKAERIYARTRPYWD